MRFGINSFLFASPFTNESTVLFKQFKKWGFDTLELAIEDPSHIDPVYVKQQLDKVGLACGSVCAAMGPDRDFRGTKVQQATAMRYMKALIDQMVILDCPSMIGPVYSSVGRADAYSEAEQKRHWALVVKNLKVLCKYAEQNGRQICLEPLNRFETDFINTCDQGLKMIKDVGSKALTLHLDTFHMNIEESNSADALRQAGAHVGHVHLADNQRLEPGTGQTDFAAAFAALRDIGFTGVCALECGLAHGPERSLTAALAALRKAEG